MAIISSLRNLFGKRQEINIIFGPEESPFVGGLDARQLYATQANLHAVISFLADSVAQLPLKVYRRNGETNRVRDRDSAAARLLYRPNADQTCYEFVNALLTEYLLMGIATVWLLPDPDSESGHRLRLIPREWIRESKADTNYAPDKLIVTARGSGSPIEIPRTEFVQFKFYSPGNPAGFQTPVASLRQALMEQVQADRFRTAIWKSGGRFNAYITRPKDVQPWDDEQRKRWVEAFREGWGSDGANAGKMPLLEDGMEIKPYQFNAQQAQYAETKQLSREDVAAAYHINPNLIWHTGSQTYASAKDNARALYSDCLGPTIQLIQQRINSFLLPMVGADPGTYVEFDLTEKLKGSFEERASILQASVGGPWLTRNEARADNNLPPIDGGDELIVPLNVIEGGQASPQDTHTDGKSADQRLIDSIATKMQKKASETRIKGRSSEDEDDAVEAVLKKFFKRQADSVLPKLGAKAAGWWDEERWNKELAEDLEPVMDTISDAHGRATAKEIGTDYNTGITRNYLKAMALGRATATNAVTYEKLKRAKEEYDPDDEESRSPADVMEKRAETEAPMLGRSLATAVAGWAVLEACQQAQRSGFNRTIEKEWHTGANPRASHAAMNGERVPIDEDFSNGAKWPGDDAIGPEETCNCNCYTEVVITEG